MKTYKTSEVAQIIGVHSNTVRMYEKLALIPQAERKANGYRVFTDFHINQFRFARKAFQIELLQNGLRKKIISAVKSSAQSDFDTALCLTKEYIAGVQAEQRNAAEAVEIVKHLLSGDTQSKSIIMKRKEVSEHLGITMDTLRNWEMNGLLRVKRKENGYRVYTYDDIRRLKIIRSLKCANYSLEAILRMLNALSSGCPVNIQQVLNTPNTDDDIISVCDTLIVSLSAAECNAKEMVTMLTEMKNKYA
ncbi:MAG: MerR family transcriptional regulator [Eubacteriales bacterium]|nr:MerR family transcriptional regulator [Eubacteriales bacterium]